MQIEIVFPFLTGTLDASHTYCDDFQAIAKKYLTSLSGFWFDFLTSLPWSFNDLYSYQVRRSCWLQCEPAFCLGAYFSVALNQRYGIIRNRMCLFLVSNKLHKAKVILHAASEQVTFSLPVQSLCQHHKYAIALT